MATENEKLLALLAEAQYCLRTYTKDEHGGSLSQGATEWLADVHQRIDAALAEPVVDYQRERDEALVSLAAETEKARGDIVLFRQRISSLKAELDRSGYGYAERKPSEVADAAFRRGVAAMRQTAADYLEEDAKFESVSMSTAAEIYANVIRNLPAPEDK